MTDRHDDDRINEHPGWRIAETILWMTLVILWGALVVLFDTPPLT